MGPTYAFASEVPGCSMDCFRTFICVSGKRKTGKDYVTRRLAFLFAKQFPTVSVSICTLSDPLKEQFALLHGMDAEELKGDGPAKELVRQEMIQFGEELRRKDNGYFCRKALSQRRLVHGPGRDMSLADVVLVSDCRRPSDLRFFRSQFSPSLPVLSLRVECPMEVRAQRGFVFKKGVDDAESECGLDGPEERWDAVVNNDGQNLDEQLEKVVDRIRMERGQQIGDDRQNCHCSVEENGKI